MTERKPPPCYFTPERVGDLYCRFCGEDRAQHEEAERLDAARGRNSLPVACGHADKVACCAECEP